MAGLYTAAQVERYAGHVRQTQIAVPVEEAAAFAHRQVKAHTLKAFAVEADQKVR